jgi:hypothetical protein
VQERHRRATLCRERTLPARSAKVGVETHLFDRQHALQALAVAGIDTASVLGGETVYVS